MAVIKKITQADMATAMAVLAPAFLDDEGEIVKQITSGEAEVFSIKNIFFVARLENTELVVVALAGKNLVSAMADIFNAAKQAGCTTIRYHTTRKAFSRILSSFQPEFVEYVYKIGVS